MKQTITVNAFRDAFRDYGRGGSFSYGGLCALFEYIEEMEADTGSEMELDVIGLCCDFSEHATAVEAASEYGYTYEASDEDGEEHGEQASLDWLRDQTTVIEFTGGIIIQGF